MVNPDGVNISINGISPDNMNYKKLLTWNNSNKDFTRWQANANGVDLNHNYDALWDLSKRSGPEYGIFGPGPTRYAGECPESEPESSAVACFTRNNDFNLVIAFHSQGQVIYWNFGNIEPLESRKIGRVFEEISPYTLDETEGIASYAGYKDWFIKEYQKPGYTVEVGLGENPLPVSQFPQIYTETLPILMAAANL